MNTETTHPDAATAIEVLDEASLSPIQIRTNQLFELIAFDPKNYLTYRNEIVEINIKLVSTVIRKYRPYDEDKFQIGCLGLIHATNNFKLEKEVPFHNFACYCIEREIHKMYKKESGTLEFLLGTDLVYLDACSAYNDEEGSEGHSVIPDIIAEGDMDAFIKENSLDKLFEKVLNPAVNEVTAFSLKRNVGVDMNQWKNLELNYLFALGDGESQKKRLTFSAMARLLNTTVPNIRAKHLRTMRIAVEIFNKIEYSRED